LIRSVVGLATFYPPPDNMFFSEVYI